MADSFHALVLRDSGGAVVNAIEALSLDELPQAEVLIAVTHSSLNYKDAMIVSGRRKMVRSYPIVPGIDLAGEVIESKDAHFSPGDAVLVTGCGIGEDWWGGYAQRARVRADWVVKIPSGFDARWAMGIGTAGFTAMLCVMALQDHGAAKDAEILVTGAAGGVGSLAVTILSALGYRVVASSGRRECHDYLRSLGAGEIIDRSLIAACPEKPLMPHRWGGAVDTVGGDTLAHVLSQMTYGASVASCGLAAGPELTTSLYPFLLRAVNLLGINSSLTPRTTRLKAWDRLARDLPRDRLERIVQTASLKEVPALSENILRGQVRGRIVVEL